jgi:cytosine deaminase
VVERALAYCDWAVSMGLLAIRSHVDTTPDHLTGSRGDDRGREQVAPISTCSSSRFRRTGSTAAERGRDNTHPRARHGVDVVGGIPHFERTMADGRASVRNCARSPPDAG